MFLAFKCFLVAPRAVASFSGNQNENIPHLLQNTTHIYISPHQKQDTEQFGEVTQPWSPRKALWDNADTMETNYLGSISIKKYKCTLQVGPLFLNSHQFKSTKSLYKFSLEASNLYLIRWYSTGFNQ